MKPICVRCRRFMRPQRTGIAFIEGMPKHSRALPGLRNTDQWQPYKLWVGDQWRCPDCGATVISGVAPQPVAEHYQTEFAGLVAALGATLQINDC